MTQQLSLAGIVPTGQETTLHSAEIRHRNMLSVHGLTKSFAGLKALTDVSFNVGANEIIGLIGPNGAGKTTLLNCISRIYTPSSGRVTFNGQDLLSVPLHGVARHGIARTFQNLEVFTSATVLENVTVNCMGQFRSSLAAELLGLRSAREKQRNARAKAAAVLDSFGLTEYADQCIGSLSFGTQKNIEFARAMASSPSLLLLDEPAAGLNPEESKSLGVLIRQLRDAHGVGILLIEHDMSLVMETCDRIVVLDHGIKIAEGTPQEVQKDPIVMAAYLGAEDSKTGVKDA